MLWWGHYQFRQRLVAKAEEVRVHVIIQNEAYTSKTCSWCGSVDGALILSGDHAGNSTTSESRYNDTAI